LFAKSDRLSGKELYLGLKEKGVLVRYFAKPRLEEYLRITVGTPEEMTVFLEKVDELLEVSYAD
jgi:histidinol-phosphate aminotransferase